MLTSGDLKSGDFLFCTIPRNVNTPPPLPTTPPTKMTYDLGHYMKSYMKFCVSVLYCTEIRLGKNTFCPACLKLSWDKVLTQARLISYIQFVSWKGYTNLTYTNLLGKYLLLFSNDAAPSRVCLV